MSEPKPLSWHFDDVAQLHDEVRPRYPEEIIAHILDFAALPIQGLVFACFALSRQEPRRHTGHCGSNPLIPICNALGSGCSQI
jgi:hypothetical protein